MVFRVWLMRMVENLIYSCILVIMLWVYICATLVLRMFLSSVYYCSVALPNKHSSIDAHNAG